MENIITILLWIVKIAGSLLAAFLIIWLYGYLVQAKFLPHWMRYWPVPILARLVSFVCGVDIEIHGKENLPHYKSKKGYAIVANHQSMFDIIILAVVSKDPIAFIAKKEIEKIPFLGTWAKTIGCPYIDRKNLRQSYGAVMVEGSQNIEKGIAMAIFPAGTRSHNNEVLDFKAGSFKMATSIGAPILPVTIIDAFRSNDANIFKRVKVSVYIHPLIEKSDYETMSSFELAKSTQAEITKPITAYLATKEGINRE